MNGETKPGYRTTEFWIMLLAQVFTVYNTFKGDEKGARIDPATAAIIVAGIGGIYTAVRGLVKGFAKPAGSTQK